MRKVSMMVLMMVLMSFIGFGQAISVDGLIAYYPFNGNMLDYTGNTKNDGQVNSTPDNISTPPKLSTDRFNKINSCYEFTKNTDEIWINKDLGNFGFGGFSISIWFYSYDNNPNSSYLLSKRIPYGAFGSWFTIGSSPHLEICGDTKYHTLNYFDKVDTVRNKWNHLVVIRDVWTNTYKMYLNGKLTFSSKFDNWLRLFDSNSYLVIGNLDNQAKYFDKSNTSFKGKIDDIRIYNRVISENEVSSLYNEGGYILLNKQDLPKINPTTKSQVLKIYPNPIIDYLNIDCKNLPNNSILHIYDMNGDLLINRKIQINYSDKILLNKGVYFIKVIDDKGIILVNKKVVKL